MKNIFSSVFRLFYLYIFCRMPDIVSTFNLRVPSTVNYFSNEQKPIFIAGYLPSSWKGWILEFLFNDLSSSSKSKNIKFCLFTSLLDLKKHYIKYNHTFVLSMHQNLLSDIQKIGIPADRVFCFYTHTRSNSALQNKYSKSIAKWLPMNHSELNALRLLSINTNNIEVFPCGVDLSVFNCKNINTRSYDVVLSLRYSTESSEYYQNRKNYKLIVRLIEMLSSNGYSSAIIGSGWEASALQNLSNVTIYDIPHHNSAEIYRKSRVYLNLGLLEGGPISLLESAACGCICLSYPSGFALDFGHSEVNGYYLLPASATIDSIFQTIVNLLDLSSDDFHYRLASRGSDPLNSFSFEYLSSQLAAFANIP